MRILRSMFVCFAVVLLLAPPLAAQKTPTPVIAASVIDGATLDNNDYVNGWVMVSQ